MLPQRVSKKYYYPEILVNADVYGILQELPPNNLIVPAPPEPPVYPYNPNLLSIYSWVAGICFALYLLLQNVYLIAWALIISVISLLLIRVRFRFALDKYHAARAYAAAYAVRVAEYDRQLKQTFPADKLWEYRLTLLKQFFGGAKKPKNITLDDERHFRKGKSEAMFYKYLVECFGSNIQINKKLDVLDGYKYNISYYPDFVYQDKTGLYIDIEIDEPYDEKNGKPMHCVGKDDDRNNFFIDNRWAVIRFTEEQVLRWPELCCKEIALVIHEINGISYTVKDFAATLPKQKKWMEYEAKAVANRMYEQEYS
ncbi:hypothetical protein [uncultured Hymenobacter sp.]|uniref:hypothetical protein n=1 Tax=uncultured Hymenobacter sp. TaxID=170016 RepID=UPI0035CC386B